MADFATGFKRKSYEQNLPLYNLMKGQVARVQLVHEPQIDCGSILQPFFVGFFQRQIDFLVLVGGHIISGFFFPQTIHFWCLVFPSMSSTSCSLEVRKLGSS
jgi:hypothetical protein